jgi:thiopeptide-type bacteriocin biosynthesis protein
MAPPFLGDETNLASYQIPVGRGFISLDDFLVYCARGADEERRLTCEDQDLVSLRSAFLSAGLRAVEAASCPLSWIQIGLGLGYGGARADVYRRLARIVHELMAVTSVHNFFFMHKPPGLRVRFEVATACREGIEQKLYEQMSLWHKEGIVTDVAPGIYEPEIYLFGGLVSMRSVHQLFTLDSLAWLDFHNLTNAEASDTTWALSLAMLQTLFEGLHIVGWEDLGVWDRIRRQTGRRLPAEALSRSEFKTFTAAIKTKWQHPSALFGELSPLAQGIAETFQQTARPVIARWHHDYFSTGQACIGPREAAAFFTIFHWNRAALSYERQSLLTEALAVRHR